MGCTTQKYVRQFSARTAEITKELDPQVREFIERNGRAPSRAALRAMAKNATMATRQPKDHAPDRARQLAVWDAKYQTAALQALADIPVSRRRLCSGGGTGAAVRCGAAAAVHRGGAGHAAAAPRNLVMGASGAGDPQDAAARCRGSVSEDGVDALVLSMVREALAGDGVVLLKPPPAVEMPGQRGSGESVYTKPSSSARYATVEHLLTEGRLVDDAARPAPPVLSPEAAARAVGSDLAAIEAERARLASDDGAGAGPAASCRRRA